MRKSSSAMGFASPEPAKWVVAALLACAVGCASTVLDVHDDDPANPRAKLPPVAPAPSTLEPGFDPKDRPAASSGAQSHDHSAHGGRSAHGHDHHAHQHGPSEPADAAGAPRGSRVDGGAPHGGHH